MTESVKKLIIVAGPNGSGKSTFTKLTNFDIPVLDPDAIARRMHPENVQSVAIAAGKEAVRLADRYIEQGRSFVRETTLAGRSPVKMIRIANKHGFETEIIYFGVESLQILRGRIDQRVLKGGHDIDTGDLKRRYHRSLESLKEVIPIVDACYLYDNSFKFHRLIAMKENGRVQTCIEILPDWAKDIGIVEMSEF